MPLTPKGKEIKKNLVKEYGEPKADRVLYAGKNKGTFTGIDKPGEDVHEGFEKVEHELAEKPGVKSPKKLAAWIGAQKYGKSGMAKKAAAGRDATNYQTTLATMPGPTDWNARDVDPIGFSPKDPNQVKPTNLSDNAMDSIKAKSFGGVSLADFGFGAKDAEPRPGAPSVLNWSAPFQFGPGGLGGPDPKQVAGGLKASGFGSSGINGKDSSFSNDSVSGTDKISKLWK